MARYTDDGQQIDIEFYCPACGETYPCRVGPEPFRLSPGQDLFMCPGCNTTFSIVIKYIKTETAEEYRQRLAEGYASMERDALRRAELNREHYGEG